MIRIQACAQCARTQSPARRVCMACGGRALALEDRVAEGSVYAVSTVHHAPDASFQALVPYVLVLVELDSGGRVMGHGEPQAAIGDRVRSVRFEHAGAALVRFVPWR